MSHCDDDNAMDRYDARDDAPTPATGDEGAPEGSRNPCGNCGGGGIVAGRSLGGGWHEPEEFEDVACDDCHGSGLLWCEVCDEPADSTNDFDDVANFCAACSLVQNAHWVAEERFEICEPMNWADDGGAVANV